MGHVDQISLSEEEKTILWICNEIQKCKKIKTIIKNANVKITNLGVKSIGKNFTPNKNKVKQYLLALEYVNTLAEAEAITAILFKKV